MGCSGVKCVHVTAQGIVMRGRLSRVAHAAENPIPPMSFPCCHAPSHIHVPTWVDVRACKSSVSGVYIFFCIHMFKTAQLRLSNALKLRWYQARGLTGVNAVGSERWSWLAFGERRGHPRNNGSNPRGHAGNSPSFGSAFVKYRLAFSLRLTTEKGAYYRGGLLPPSSAEESGSKNRHIRFSLLSFWQHLNKKKKWKFICWGLVAILTKIKRSRA